MIHSNDEKRHIQQLTPTTKIQTLDEIVRVFRSGAFDHRGLMLDENQMRGVENWLRTTLSTLLTSLIAEIEAGKRQMVTMPNGDTNEYALMHNAAKDQDIEIIRSAMSV